MICFVRGVCLAPILLEIGLTREIINTDSTYINLAIGEAIHVDFLVVQDERELKRQRRKQSNRESARRSRLRKQVIFSSA